MSRHQEEREEQGDHHDDHGCGDGDAVEQGGHHDGCGGGEEHGGPS